MPNCVCEQYRPIYDDIKNALNEKSETIDKLIKEHVGMRKEIDIARDGYRHIQNIIKLPEYKRLEIRMIEAAVNESLAKMDEIRKGYSNG